MTYTFKLAHRLAVLRWLPAFAALSVAAACDDTTDPVGLDEVPDLTAPPSTASSSPGDNAAPDFAVTATGCPASYTRKITVASSSALKRALSGARAGDLIVMADGRYAGHFKAAASGTAGAPIVVCGSEASVIDGGSTSGGGFAFTLTGSHWTLQGFTVTNAHQGIALHGARYSTVRDVRIHRIGQEALRLKANASHNVIEQNHIHDTGLARAEWGEGVYLGSYRGHWCRNSGCEPDRTDANRIQGNTIGPNVRAELIDAKEGTTGNIIRDNVLKGAGQVRSQSWIDSWVEINGDDYVVEGNTGTDALKHGFQVATVYYKGRRYGNGNRFSDNTADVQASGYGFMVDTRASGSTVSCTNTVRNAGSGDSNLECR